MELSYSVQRSANRKKLTITVERDRTVVVHAPLKTSQEVIQRVLDAKRQWIFHKIHHDQKYQDLPHPPGKELVSGESALYLGRPYRVQIVQNGLREIQLTRRLLIPASHTVGRKGALREWYVAQAKEKILPRVERHARGLGVEFNKAKIVDSKYRWGSCTTRDNLTFNWRLIKAPMFVIDYVIVHELAHLIVANHSAHFWNIVRANVPNAAKARVWLVDNGQVLEEEI
jgi:predicted metal-dependent hydrolase